MRDNEFVWKFLISSMKPKKIVPLLKVTIVILLGRILPIVTDEADVERRMENAISNLKQTILSLSPHASANILDPIKVRVNGEMLKLDQLGAISVPDSRLITIQVENQTYVKFVVKAILTSGLGLYPYAAGQMVRVPIPVLTGERRLELQKKADDYGENAKVAVRNLRREVVQTLKRRYKNKEISEDEMNSYTDDVQKRTDWYIRQIDRIIKKKHTDISPLSYLLGGRKWGPYYQQYGR